MNKGKEVWLVKKNRNKGFSMMELIVVIAIIGLFTGLASIGLQYVQAGNIRSTAKSIDSNLTKLRLDTMRKEEKPIMYLYKVGDDYYMLCTTDSSMARDRNNGTHIGNSNTKITVDGSVLGSTEKKIKFKKGSGAFSDDSDARSSILVEKQDGKGTSYKIVLVPDTGKHYMEIK